MQALGLVGAAFCLWAFMSTTDRDSWLYHGGFLLFAVATAFVIVAIIQPVGSPLGRVLSIGPVRWVGMISYGLYLWHWPVAIALSEPRTGLSGWDLSLVRLAATFGFATVSYYVVERPIRYGALKGWVARASPPRAAFLVTAVVTVALTAGGTAAPGVPHGEAEHGDREGAAVGGHDGAGHARSTTDVGSTCCWSATPSPRRSATSSSRSPPNEGSS